MTVSWTVTNIGNASTGDQAPVDWIMINADSIADPHTATRLGGDIVGQPLDPEASYTSSATVSLPAGISGAWHLFVWTDVDVALDDPDLGNNLSGVYTIQISTPPPPDLTLTDVSAAEHIITAGTSVPVQWTVANIGAGPTASSSWVDAVYLSTDQTLDVASDTRILRLLRQERLDPDAQYTRQRNITVPSGLNGTYYLFVTADADNVVYEGGHDDNNAMMHYAPLEIRPPVIEEPLIADLQVTALGVTPVVQSGGQAPLTWTVQNFGPDETAVGSWADYVYISADNILSPTTDHLALVKMHSGALVINETYSVSESVQIPDGYEGGYHIIVKTDAENTVAEGIWDGNNVRFAPFDVRLTPPPDLQVTALGAPVMLVPGEQATVQWKVTNLGAGPTEATGWIDRFYLSPDSTLETGSDIYIAGVTRAGALDPGYFYQESRLVQFPTVEPGDWHLIVLTDAVNSVYEHLHEGNNARVTAVSFVAPEIRYPDLAMTVLQYIDGEFDSITFTVTNLDDNSVLPSQRSWTDRFYLSPDPVLDAGADYLIASHPRIGDLQGHASYSARVKAALPEGLQGDYYVIGKSDGDGKVSETDESNNELPVLQTITISPADLQVVSLGCPDTLIAGQPAVFSWTVENAGSGPCDPGAWYDGVYLSLDRILDETDIVLGAKYHGDGLAPGSRYSGGMQATISMGISGTWYVFVSTDKNNSVYEHGGEGNNIAYTPDGVTIVIPPANVDLVVSDVQVPASCVSGDSIAIGWTITNLSEYPVVGIWRDGIYISSDESWDLSDIYLGEAGYTGGLQARERLERTFTIATSDYLGILEATAPGLVPGGYRAIVRTDIKNNINESGEENNEGYSAGEMTLDLLPLILGEAHSDAIGYGERRYFRVTVPSGHDLRFITDCEGMYDELDMFVRYNAVPDRIDYDFKFKLKGHNETIIPGGGASDCYLMIFGDYTPGGGTFTILAESYLFSLASVDPDIVDNTGIASLVITGGHLADAESVTLTRAGSDTVAAWDVHVVNSTKVIAGFELDRLLPGVYDLSLITSAQNTTSLASAVTVLEGGGPVVQPWITGPSAVRIDVCSDNMIVLENEGNADAHDVITGITMQRGTRYQLVLDGVTTPLRTYDSAPILVYTSFIGAGKTAEFVLRTSSLEDDIFTVTAIHTLPVVRGTAAAYHVVSSWVQDAATAFMDRLEYDGALIDREQVMDEFVNAWNLTRQIGEGFTATSLLETKVDRSCLLTAAALGDPEIPAEDAGITSYGISSAETSARDSYVAASSDSRFKKTTKSTTVRVARDPNEKVGPTPEGENNFISQLDRISYTVYFENVPDASAAARQVFVTDELDPRLDPRSFRLGEIAWADTVLSIPTNLGYYHGIVELSTGYLLEISAGVDYLSRVARWTFTTIDPLTGLPPLDPAAGFLQPNDENGCGEGHVLFSIKPADDVVDGDGIANKALIVFDSNDPIETNEVLNVIRRSNPDLVVAGIAGDSPHATYMEGEPIQLRAAVANIGAAGAGGFTAAFYDGDPLGSGVMIGAPVPVEFLESGQQTDIGVSWIPGETLGERSVYVVVDLGDVITEVDEENNRGSFSFLLEPKQYAITLDGGINLVALPLMPAETFSARSFAAHLGATQVIRYDPNEDMFESFVPAQSEGDGFEIVPGEGYIIHTDDSHGVVFEGTALDGGVTVRAGMNFVSLPREPEQPILARDFIAALEGDMLIRYAPSQGRFDAFISDFHAGDGFEIAGACGYLAYCHGDKTAYFEGTGWAGERYASLGAELLASTGEDPPPATHVLGLCGRVVVEVWGERTPPGDRCSGVFTNTATGAKAKVRIDGDTGEICGAFIDFNNSHPVTAGDVLEFVLLGENGKPVCEPVELTVEAADIANCHVALQAVISNATPSISLLYQNFPNPFNPVTRIRYQLASKGPVNLRVYNVAGQLVKTLVGSIQNAGYYEIAWDGRNDGGRQVSSGIYFCRLDAPGYTKSMKMVVLR
ncbi:MAG: CARDB domain-containing protein [Candidatus Krumholzibacteria bacterium]|nr:CARDB domain-containing protein [Candidatus Krumholzibacteria bacterium]